MEHTSDVQKLEARISELENQLKELRGMSNPSHTSGNPSGAVGSSSDTEEMHTPATWLAGTLTHSLLPQAGIQVPLGQVAPFMENNSVWWCTSRFICATMECGGSSWC